MFHIDGKATGFMDSLNNLKMIFINQLAIHSTGSPCMTTKSPVMKYGMDQDLCKNGEAQ